LCYSLFSDELKPHYLSLLNHISVYIGFLNATPTTAIITLSLHDALPISQLHREISESRGSRTGHPALRRHACGHGHSLVPLLRADRKSTRLNSSQFRCRMLSSALLNKKNLV